MKMSENINELADALSKAQGEITGALKDSQNPFFKSKYADLASCWDAARDQLSKHGLAVCQIPETTEKGISLATVLMHKSGQWISGDLEVFPQDTKPQSAGSAITYARRYAFSGFTGVAQVDDDGNAASGKANGNGHYAEPHRPQGDIPKSVPAGAAQDAANRMHVALHEGDVEENIRALRVLDLHDILNKDQETYVAAADLLTPKDRAAFKTYVSLAKAAEKADKAASGKRF